MSEINRIAIIIAIVIGCPLTSLGAPLPVVTKSLLFFICYVLMSVICFVITCYTFHYHFFEIIRIVFHPHPHHKTIQFPYAAKFLKHE